MAKDVNLDDRFGRCARQASQGRSNRPQRSSGAILAKASWVKRRYQACSASSSA
jgi:hypothetical protein